MPEVNIKLKKDGTAQVSSKPYECEINLRQRGEPKRKPEKEVKKNAN